MFLLDTSSGFKIKEEATPISSKSTDYSNIYPDSTTLSNILTSAQLEMPENNVNMNIKDGKQFALRPNSRRKRLCSNSSQLSNNESLTSVEEKKKNNQHRKKRKSKYIIFLNSTTRQL